MYQIQLSTQYLYTYFERVFHPGSFGTILYLANGPSDFPKERVEVFVNDSVMQLDNFRKLKGFGVKGFKTCRSWRQDKGQKNCVNEFVQSIITGSASPIPAEEIFGRAPLSNLHEKKYDPENLFT